MEVEVEKKLSTNICYQTDSLFTTSKEILSAFICQLVFSGNI
jgi:hypothetical protein